jgi:hypothetical protein
MILLQLKQAPPTSAATAEIADVYIWEQHIILATWMAACWAADDGEGQVRTCHTLLAWCVIVWGQRLFLREVGLPFPKIVRYDMCPLSRKLLDMGCMYARVFGDILVIMLIQVHGEYYEVLRSSSEFFKTGF